MSEPKAQQEPTMEEILASIRRIISEDGEDGEAKPDAPSAAAAPAPPPPLEAEPAAPEPEPFDDVLELTQMVDDEGSVVSLAGGLTDDDIEIDDAPPPPDTRPSFGPAFGGDEPEPVVDEWEPAPAQTPPPGGLLSPDSAALANAAFLRVGALLTSGPGGPQTVEDLVKELLKPMLRSWLDQNLPQMVERLVAEEIARVSGRGR